MNHTEALNLLLANSCRVDHGEDDLRTFVFDLHCVEAKITARLVSTVDSIQYEIINVEMEAS